MMTDFFAHEGFGDVLGKVITRNTPDNDSIWLSLLEETADAVLPLMRMITLPTLGDLECLPAGKSASYFPLGTNGRRSIVELIQLVNGGKHFSLSTQGLFTFRPWQDGIAPKNIQICGLSRNGKWLYVKVITKRCEKDDDARDYALLVAESVHISEVTLAEMIHYSSISSRAVWCEIREKVEEWYDNTKSRLGLIGNIRTDLIAVNALMRISSEY